MPAAAIAELARLSSNAASTFERLVDLVMAGEDPELHRAIIDFASAFGLTMDFVVELSKRSPKSLQKES